MLGNAVHRLAIAHVVQSALIILRCLALLLLEPDNLALLQLVLAVALVVLGYLAIADANLLADSLEGIATTGNDIIVLIEYLDVWSDAPVGL